MPHYAKPKPTGWTCPVCGRRMQREWTPHTCNGQFRKHWPKPRKPSQHGGYAALWPALAALWVGTCICVITIWFIWWSR